MTGALVCRQSTASRYSFFSFVFSARLHEMVSQLLISYRVEVSREAFTILFAPAGSCIWQGAAATPWRLMIQGCWLCGSRSPAERREQSLRNAWLS